MDERKVWEDRGAAWERGRRRAVREERAKRLAAGCLVAVALLALCSIAGKLGNSPRTETVNAAASAAPTPTFDRWKRP